MMATASPRELDQFAVRIIFHKSADKYQVLIDFAMRYSFYAALTAIFLMVIALIVKLMWSCDVDEDGRATETSRLFLAPKGAKVINYGTSGTNDLESGNSSSSDEDLYDGKICVICYDDQRTCFFIPCGHCVACHTCANRIVNEESKSCPICRGIIEKVRKLHIV
ncbi:hypothetical protein ACS0TY_029996 [Phlomoides rotata]